MSMAEAGKKRVTLLDPADSTPLKKARLSPPAQDDEETEDDEPETEEQQNLEAFRKEAIWRQMREHKQLAERAQETVTSLERENANHKARLAAVDISWNSLVQQATVLLPSTSTAAPTESDSPNVSDPTLTTDELQAALAKRSAATVALLTRLGTLQPAAQVDQLQAKCHTLIQQSSEARETIRLLREQHQATIDKLESTNTELLKAERRFARAQSLTVAKMEGKPAPSPTPTGASTPTNGAPTVNGTASTSDSSAPHPIVPGLAAPNAEEVDDLRRLVESRAVELDGLRKDRVALKMELDALRVKLKDLRQEDVMDSEPFKLLQSHVQHLAQEAEVKKAELERVQKEADELRENGEAFRETAVREASEQVEEVQKRLLAKEGDLARIRAERESYRAEATELKVRDADKQRYASEIKTLVTSKEERITAYDSEVRRLKMQIAAAKGQGETVELLASRSEEDIVHDLQARVKTADELLLTLGNQLQAFAAASSDPNAATLAQSESDARRELVATRAKLAAFEAQLGPEATPEVRELSAKLVEREGKIKELEAQLQSQEHATNMLYGEIDTLSGAWAKLDEQNGAKVFNLQALEDKVQRLVGEKAKADNRYFTAMRTTDALKSEAVVLQKVAEKQQRAVDAGKDAQQSLSAQLRSAEQEITAHQHSVRAHQAELDQLRRESADFKLRHDHHSRRIDELNALLAERVGQAEAESAARQQVEERLAKAQRELEAAKAAVAATASTGGAAASDSGKVKELKEYNQDLMKMLRCGTCQQRFKSVIISLCGHLFCKECIDARINSRQRKCPTCAIPFGKADVSTIYF